MNNAKFILSREKAKEQYDKLKELGVKISYSYKTNKEVGQILDKETDSEFSIHNEKEIDEIKNRGRIWFFLQAQSVEQIKEILGKGVKNFVVDNEIDLNNLLFCTQDINLLLRMKFQEHRLGAERYYTYGMSARKINELIQRIKVNKLGIHIHRKSQNTSEWNILEELQESLSEESLDKIDIINVGGGLPIRYRTYTAEVMPYVFEQIRKVKDLGKEIYVEPGRFVAGPSVRLETEILQIQDETIIINTSIYNCALDTIITDIRMLVEGELEEGDSSGTYWKIKGNSPTRDDLFRHKVRLSDAKVKVRGKLIFLNAGAYNYTTDFCGFEKLKTEII